MLSCSHDHIVVGFTTTGTCAIRTLPTTVVSSNPSHAEVCSIQHKVCQWLVTDQWFTPGTLVSSTNETDRHEWYNWNIVESGIKHHNPNPELAQTSCKCILSWWKSRQLLVSYFTNMNSTKQLLCLSLNSKIQEANRNLWKSCSWFETGTQCGWA